MLRFFILIAAVAISLAGAVSRADAAETQAFQIGGARVWAIADNTGDRDMSVFLTDQETLKKYAPTGKSPSGVLCFLLELPDGKTVLLDTGNGNPPGGERASLLMDGLATIDLKPEAIDVVIITHMHGDHIGGLVWEGKAAFPNATVMVGRIEHDFWTDERSVERFPERKGNFDRARQVMGMYKGKVETFEFGVEILPGMIALDSRGHTPGHTALLYQSEGKRLLCIGDLVHSAALQFARPEINSRYDMHPSQSLTSRWEFLGRAARENLPVAGMHLPFPGIGMVKDDGPGSFTYHPGL